MYACMFVCMYKNNKYFSHETFQFLSLNIIIRRTKKKTKECREITTTIRKRRDLANWNSVNCKIHFHSETEKMGKLLK